MTPGIWPLLARLRKQIRHISNRRKYARERPHSGQRLYPRTLNFGFCFAFTLSHNRAMSLPLLHRTYRTHTSYLSYPLTP